jgi:hypothetical protein
MEFVFFLFGFFTGFIFRTIFLSSKNFDKKSSKMEKSYLRKGLYTHSYNITQNGIKLKTINVEFEVVEIEKTPSKSKIKVLDLVASSAEYNNNSTEKNRLKSMIENSWIESKEIEWIDDDLLIKREEKLNNILNES